MIKQRQLKFRAWDNKTKKFIATDFHILGEVMCFGLIEQYIDENMCGAKSSLDRWNDIVITQFTGLQDKNGKDIYEGDLIKVFRGFGCEWDDYIGEIIFYDYSFKVKSKNQYNSLGFIDYECPRPEIIGNTFENPDLLNKNI